MKTKKPTKKRVDKALKKLDLIETRLVALGNNPLMFRQPALSDDSPVLQHNLSHNQRAFLKAYVQSGGAIGRAARAVGITAIPHYQWLHNNPEYKKAFELAKPLAHQTLEDEAIRRSNEGYLRPVYQGGKLVGYEQMYSDRLMEVVLKAKMPETYREGQTINVNTPIQINILKGEEKL